MAAGFAGVAASVETDTAAMDADMPRRRLVPTVLRALDADPRARERFVEVGDNAVATGDRMLVTTGAGATLAAVVEACLSPAAVPSASGLKTAKRGACTLLAGDRNVARVGAAGEASGSAPAIAEATAAATSSGDTAGTVSASLAALAIFAGVMLPVR